jgi:hypothetical protein
VRGQRAASTLTSVPTSTDTTSVNPSSGHPSGELHAEPAEHPAEARRHEPSRLTPEDRADHPDDRGLQHDRREHLQRRRTDRPEQRELDASAAGPTSRTCWR